MSIRQMRLKRGKNLEAFKKPRQAEFQKITCNNYFTSIFLIKLVRKQNEHPLHASQHLNISFLASQLPNLVAIVIGSL